jgi:Protein of unknown function (DUF760)
LSLQQSLGLAELPDHHFISDQFLLSNGKGESFDHLDGKVQGKIRVKYSSRSADDNSLDDDFTSITNMGGINNDADNNNNSNAMVNIEVDANAYLAELRTEVKKLRDEFTIVRKEQEEKLLKQDLLTFIRTLPPRELQGLTNTMSQDVLIGMKGLVHAVLTGIGNNNGQNEYTYGYNQKSSSSQQQQQQQQTMIGPDTLIEQSTEALAQLCMWQLVTGYNLRTLEVREEMKQSLLQTEKIRSSTVEKKSEDDNNDDDESIGILQ